MITCTTVLKVKEECGEACERLLKGLVENVRTHEPGTTLFQLARSQTSPQTYLVIEQYANEEALALHSRTEYLKATVPVMLTYLEEAPLLESFDPVA
jgi:quinol monooxygenase YgiN